MECLSSAKRLFVRKWLSKVQLSSSSLAAGQNAVYNSIRLSSLLTASLHCQYVSDFYRTQSTHRQNANQEKDTTSFT